MVDCSCVRRAALSRFVMVEFSSFGGLEWGLIELGKVVMVEWSCVGIVESGLVVTV